MAALQFLPSLDMMHYSGIDPAGVPYNTHSPNVTVMNRGTSAAAMQAAAWSQNPTSCRYNPSEYMPGSTAATFGTDPINFYQDTYRHPLISGNSAMSGVYYQSHQMLMQGRTITSPGDLSVSNTSPTVPATSAASQPSTELASPTDSLCSKGNLLTICQFNYSFKSDNK